MDGWDLHCSLGEGRSFTDPVSNWVLISGLRLERHLGGMIQAGRYPARYMPDFLHEFVHHLCFFSPVGAASALLQMRARRRAVLLQLDRNRTFDDLDVLEDTLRYETVVSLMRPLAEGLALFAEFDAFPGDSRILSNALLHTAASFSDVAMEQIGETDSVDGAAKKVLWQFRTNPLLSERKANLLAQPFSVENGGYLPGYLTVKNLQSALIAHGNADNLIDSDLHFQFVRSFFYDDYGFAAVLLDPKKTLSPFDREGIAEHDSSQAISTYFQGRFAKLLEYTSNQTLAAYEQATLDDSEERFSLGTDPGQRERGRALIEQAVGELRQDVEGDEVDTALRCADLATLYQRELMCIGSFRTSVRVNEHGRVLVGHYEDTGLPQLSGPAEEAAEQGHGEGSIEFFLSPSRRFMAHATWLNGKLVQVGSASDNFEDETREEFRNFLISLEHATERLAAWNGALEQVVGEGSGQIYREHYRAEFKRVLEHIYVPKALLTVPDDGLDAAIEALSSKGFYGVLGEDYDLVRSVAQMSVAASVAPVLGLAADVIERSREQTLELLDRVEAHCRRVGLTAFVRRDDLVFWRL